MLADKGRENRSQSAADAHSVLAENVSDFLFDFLRLQQQSPLFRVKNRDWPWMVYVRKCELSGREATVGEVGGILNVSYPTVRKILNMFEEQGFLAISRDQADKRKAIVRLSAVGRNEMERFEREMGRAIASISETIVA